MKIASIVSRPLQMSDDGRALNVEWQLFLNDNGGSGFWHGGPGHPRHCSTYRTEQAARQQAEGLGYAIISTAWT